MANDRHWLVEGDGPDFVVMCVPPVVTPASAPEPPPMEDPPGGYNGYP